MMLIGKNRNKRPFLLKPKPACDPHQFNYGDIFFTNVSIFDYSVVFIEGSDGFSYSKAPLGAICNFIYYGVKVDATQRSVQSLVGLVYPPSNKHQTHK